MYTIPHLHKEQKFLENREYLDSWAIGILDRTQNWSIIKNISDNFIKRQRIAKMLKTAILKISESENKVSMECKRLPKYHK